MVTLSRSLTEIVEELRAQEPILINSSVGQVTSEVASLTFEDIKNYNYKTRGLEERSYGDLGRLVYCYSRRLVVALCFYNFDTEGQGDNLRFAAAVTFGKAGHIAHLISNSSRYNKAKWAVRSYLCRKRAAGIYESFNLDCVDQLLSLLYTTDTALFLLECLTSGRINIDGFSQDYDKEKLKEMARGPLVAAIFLVNNCPDVFSPKGRLDRFYRDVLRRYDLGFRCDLAKEVLPKDVGQVGVNS